MRILGIDPGLFTCSFVSFTVNFKKSKFKIRRVKRLNFLEVPLCSYVSKKGKECGLHGIYNLDDDFRCNKHKNCSYKKSDKIKFTDIPLSDFLRRLTKILEKNFKGKFYDEIYIENTNPYVVISSDYQRTVITCIMNYFSINSSEKTVVELIDAKTKFNIIEYGSLSGRKNYSKRKKALRDIYLKLFSKVQPDAEERFFSKYIKIDDQIDAFAIAFINILPRFERGCKLLKYFIPDGKFIGKTSKKIKEEIGEDKTEETKDKTEETKKDSEKEDYSDPSRYNADGKYVKRDGTTIGVCKPWSKELDRKKIEEYGNGYVSKKGYKTFGELYRGQFSKRFKKISGK